MKLDQLRQIIREEVRAAVKEELQDVMNEAVRIASTPTQMQLAPKPGTSDWTAIVPTIEESSVVAKQPSRQELAELIGLKTPPKATNIEFTKDKKLNSLLAETQASMSNEDYQQVFTGTSDMVRKPNFASSMASSMGMSGTQPGLDISQLSFVKNAKKVLDLANQKSRSKV
jgi:hypothetical protein